MGTTNQFSVVVESPQFISDPRRSCELIKAAMRAGATAVFDLENCESDRSASEALLSVVNSYPGSGPGHCGFKCSYDRLSDFAGTQKVALEAADLAVIVLTAGAAGFEEKKLASVISSLSKKIDVWVEVISKLEGQMAQRAGASALILKGSEGAGRVPEHTTFVLLQEVNDAFTVPYVASGGIGTATAAAARVAGARGVVLNHQLLLSQESPLSLKEKEKVRGFDGTHTGVFKLDASELYRYTSRPGSPDAVQLSGALDQLAAAGASTEARRALVAKSVAESLDRNSLFEGLTPVGQDICFALELAAGYGSTGSIVKAVLSSVEHNLKAARQSSILSEDALLAQENGTRYPILQGAMTRVSDKADFALAVARAGSLPFLALALNRAGELDALLSDTVEKLGELPWGVGILGFVPQQLRAEQLEVVKKYRPKFALIAGGRPDQAQSLESMGIKTYLHVPSPVLLASFIELGSRRFIFEGRECGGHVGPRSSFILWQQMIDVLAQFLKKEPKLAGEFHVIFAGGIHDALSSAMLQALCAPLSALGVKVGALLGTAYLFCEEAVSTGAIVPRFQKAALECESTVLYETGPGHAIRCVDSPYKITFEKARRDLESQDRDRNEVRQELELMNLGRLRIASKGVTRSENLQSGDSKSEDSKSGDLKSGLEELPEEKQWSEGMYMIGQIASLRKKTTTMARLHDEISRQSMEILDSIPAEQTRRFTQPAEISAHEPVAVVGMACMFPGANDLETFWENILNKVDAIEEVPADQWDVNRYYDADPLAPDKAYSRWGGFLKEIPFDPAVYGIPPSSLASVDPMQLVILEVVRAALADAGYSTREFNREKTSVVVANAGHGPIGAFYAIRSILDWTMHDMDPEYRKVVEKRLPEWTEDSFPGYLGNVIAGRVANRFDFGGLNFCVDAACASSLAALHVGMRELRCGSSDVVVLAATDTHNQPGDYLSFSKTHALSPRGRCRTFDATADGIVISEGIAVLVLKRLSDAERDGDRIYSVIKGIGGSSDGRDLSLTAPRPEGQMKAIVRAYEDAGVLPSTVSLVEAHGTGTVAGDKAEVEALGRIFAGAGAEIGGCAIGSVKTMIGHTKCAAGLASLIKVSKSLYHNVLPPTLGVETPNPACNFQTSPFYINSESRPWIAGGENNPRRAGVSAFGFGGTNFHAVLEEYTGQNLADRSSAFSSYPGELFVFKASSQAVLLKAMESLLSHARLAAGSHGVPTGPMRDRERRSLFDLSLKNYLAGGHVHLNDETNTLRLAIVASSLEDLTRKLESSIATLQSGKPLPESDPKGVYYANTSGVAAPRVAFLFPGQGAQQVNMLRDLALNFSCVKETFAEADNVLSGKFSRPLSRFVFPAPAFSDDEKKQQRVELTDTSVAQSAIAAANIAALRLLREFGLVPQSVAGHSFGEYAALSCAGVMDTESLFHIAQKRGEILKATNGKCAGSMTAVSARASEVKNLLSQLEGVTLSNINSPSQCIISGSVEELSAATRMLSEHKLPSKPIAVSAAFHSPLMVPARDELAAELGKYEFKAPLMDVYSNTTASLYPSDPGSIREILSDHLVRPVEFQDEIEAMYKDGVNVFVECGPGAILTNLVSDILAGKAHLAVSLERQGRSGTTQLQHLLGALFVRGVKIDLEPLFKNRVFPRIDSPSEPVRGAGKLTYLIDGSHIQRFDRSTVAQPGGRDKYPRLQYGVVVSPGSTAAAPSPETAARRKSNAMSAAAGIQTSGHDNNGRNSGGEVKAPKTVSTERASGVNSGQAVKPQSVSPPPTENMSSRQVPASPVTRVQAPLNPDVPGQRLGRQTVLKPLSGTAAGLGARDRVVMEFQQSMMQMTSDFIDTQKSVMMAYLNQGATQHSASAPGSARMADKTVAPGAYCHSGADELNTVPALAATYQLPAEVRASISGSGAETGAQSQARSELRAGPQIPVPFETPASADNKAGTGIAGGPEHLIATLVEIVSERTGYPADMLDPSLDLETDLGIDSIKRVEILNSFRKHLPETKQRELESSIETLASSRTLESIFSWIRSELSVESNTRAAAVSSMPEPSAESSSPRGDESQAEQALTRAVVKIVPCPLPGSEADMGWTLVAASSSFRNELLSVLKARRIDCEPVALEEFKDLRKSASLLRETLSGLIRQKGSPRTILLAPEFDENDSYPIVEQIFLFLKTFDEFRQPGTRVMGVIKGNGAFGFSEICKNEKFNPYTGALAGIVKSCAREWDTRGKTVDIGGQFDASSAERVVRELEVVFDAFVEIGYLDDQRVALEVLPAPLVVSQENNNAALDSNSVVLVTGGARGITAELVKTMAGLFRCRFVILGRSSRPAKYESSETLGVEGRKELKAVLMDSLKRKGEKVSIPAVEALYKEVIRDREIRRNLEDIESAGASVDYRSVDVRDADAFSRAIADVYELSGKIDAVVHGAGVIEDALVKDKIAESFERVYRTKVDSAMTLARKLDLSSVKYLIFLSSVVGRTGNAGQWDYVAANETVNKLAQVLSRTTSARVVSLGWGPWRGGMASSDLEEIFARFGWAMIERNAGCEAFRAELAGGRREDAEVLLVAETATGTGTTSAPGARVSLGKVVTRTADELSIELESGPGIDGYLDDHKLDGVPVLPMAAAVELLCETAQTFAPDMTLGYLENLDIPSGIMFDSGRKTLLLSAKVESRSKSKLALNLSISTRAQEGTRTNFRARAVLSPAPERVFPDSLPARYQEPSLVQPSEQLPTPSEIYERILFHGPIFQGIVELSGMGIDGAFGAIRTVPSTECVTGAASEWMVDPVLLDSAMQIAGVWGREFLDVTMLPTGMKCFRILSPRKGRHFKALVTTKPESQGNELLCDLAVYNADGEMVMAMEGLTAVGSKSLNRLAGRTGR